MDIVNFFNKLYLFVSGFFSTELVSALIGALIGGLFTSRQTRKAHELESAKNAENEEVTTNNTLKLIQVELNTAWDLYDQEYVVDLRALPADAPHLYTLPIGDNPFPVFDSSPPHLANLPPELSAKIVRIYMRIKGLVKMIESNNTDCTICADHARAQWKKEFEKAKFIICPVPKKIQDQVDAIYNQEVQILAAQLGMGESANNLKSMTDELEILLSDINKDINLLLTAKP